MFIRTPSYIAVEGGSLGFRIEGARDAFRVVYLSRGRHRTTRRDLSSSLKLASLAKELSNAYLEVIEWQGWRRALALRT